MQLPVKMYTLSTCSHCKSAKKFLNDCAVKYKFTDTDTLTGDKTAAIIEDVKKIKSPLLISHDYHRR